MGYTHRNAKNNTRKNKKDKYQLLIEESLKEVINAPESFGPLVQKLRRFRKYSHRNAYLIMAQNPNATHVAGKSEFEALGGTLKDGEQPITIIGVSYKINKDNEAIADWLLRCPTNAYKNLFPQESPCIGNTDKKGKLSWYYPPKFPPSPVIQQIESLGGKDFVANWHKWEQELQTIRSKRHKVPPTSKKFIHIPVYDISSFSGIDIPKSEIIKVDGENDLRDLFVQVGILGDDIFEALKTECSSVATSGKSYERVSEKDKSMYGEIAAQVIFRNLGIKIPYSIDVLASQWKTPNDVLKDIGKITRIVNVVMDKFEPEISIQSDKDNDRCNNEQAIIETLFF